MYDDDLQEADDPVDQPTRNRDNSQLQASGYGLDHRFSFRSWY